MTKQEILDEFSDINHAYNNSSKHETLSLMLDELLNEQQEAVIPDTNDYEWVCGSCKYPVELERKTSPQTWFHSTLYSYCPNCGKKVNWDDKRRSNNPKSSGTYRKLGNHEGRH